LLVVAVSLLLTDMLMSMRRTVTNRDIRPGTSSGGIRKLTQEATTKMLLGKYTLMTRGMMNLQVRLTNQRCR
jgi:hypothetical protein